MSDQILTTEDVADILMCSERHVKKLIRDKELKAKKVANKWLIYRSDVDAFLKGDE